MGIETRWRGWHANLFSVRVTLPVLGERHGKEAANHCHSLPINVVLASGLEARQAIKLASRRGESQSCRPAIQIPG